MVMSVLLGQQKMLRTLQKKKRRPVSSDITDRKAEYFSLIKTAIEEGLY